MVSDRKITFCVCLALRNIEYVQFNIIICQYESCTKSPATLTWQDSTLHTDCPVDLHGERKVLSAGVGVQGPAGEQGGEVQEGHLELACYLFLRLCNWL